MLLGVGWEIEPEPLATTPPSGKADAVEAVNKPPTKLAAIPPPQRAGGTETRRYRTFLSSVVSFLARRIALALRPDMISLSR
jgi:hypothetical protein